ncbi:MAG: RIP metalloprotease RseP [Bacteroidales bacterium]|jgi:regulator of sigma E protease|nr:RIP metalloprotease RseP [Bacteroidales bacterium]
MEILIKTSQFVLSLSFIVIAHELGHFLFARLFHTRVEKFYLFFDPWFSLFKTKKGDTEYGIGWLPLGGYVKISGMIDESLDTEKMKQPPQPWEFRSKPSWQRLLIMIAGVVVNFFAALLIYSMIMYTWGMDYVAMKDAAYGYRFCNTALQNGFRNGDKIVAIDGQHYERPSDAFNAIIIENAQTVTVERNDTIIDIRLPADFAQQCVNERKVFAEISLPGIVEKVVAGSPAEGAGVQPGDFLKAVNGVPVPFYDHLIREVRKNSGQPVLLTVERDGNEQVFTLTVSKDSTIGVNLQVDPNKILKVTHVEYGFWASFPAGVRYGVDKLVSYVKSLRFLKNGISQLSGFIGIGKIFPSTWNWHGFWDLTALLSIILAFMNILPIPALDGGHVLFLLVEIITRRKPSDKFLEKAQIIGMVLLIGLLLIANGNDIIRLFFPNH